MSNGARAEISGRFSNIAEELKKWDERKDLSKEADKLAARRHRLVALFRSANCYSANVHACTHGLSELVDSLVRLNRMPAQTSAEGLHLLAEAWDKLRRTQKDGHFGTEHAIAAVASSNGRHVHGRFRAARFSIRRCMWQATSQL